MRRRDFLKLGAVVAVAAACDVSTEAESLVIVDAEVFDGERHLGRRDVAVRDGVIEQVGEGLEANGAAVVDAAGGTLLPGFIDAHTHTYEASRLRQALLFGVTTQLDMFTDPSFAARLRGGNDEADRAYLLSSGYLATSPEGHGTQFGLPVPTLTGPEQAEAWVADRADEGSDYIKIVVDEWGDGPLDGPVVEALADAARDRGLLSVAHAMTAATARTAVEAGVDGLAHTVVEPIDDETFAMAVDRDVFLITTISVLAGSDAPAMVLHDDRLSRWLHPPDVRHLEEATDISDPDFSPYVETGLEVASRWHHAGAPVLAGSDARNPGVIHGASIHVELELLVDAGLEPQAALAAATSTPAAVFGLDDRGRIAQGRRADLLLVDGDPLEDITATRDIARTWKRGTEVDRDAVFDRTQP